jgi:hypothetical protein
VLSAPEAIGERMKLHTRPSTAMLGMAGKNSADRTKLRPANFLLSTTASGIAITVTSTVVPTAKSRVNASPASMDGSRMMMA